MTPTPARGKTTAKSTSTSFAPKTQTPGSPVLTPTRNLLQISTDSRTSKVCQPADDVPPTAADFAKREELDAVLADLHTHFGICDDDEPHTLIARNGYVIGVEPDDWTDTTAADGWRWQKEYGILMPALRTVTGQEWHERLSSLGHLNYNVDASPGARGFFGAEGYPVRPYSEI